jgi:hypothetical protein
MSTQRKFKAPAVHARHPTQPLLQDAAEGHGPPDGFMDPGAVSDLSMSYDNESMLITDSQNSNFDSGGSQYFEDRLSIASLSSQVDDPYYVADNENDCQNADSDAGSSWLLSFQKRATIGGSAEYVETSSTVVLPPQEPMPDPQLQPSPRALVALMRSKYEQNNNPQQSAVAAQITTEILDNVPEKLSIVAQRRNVFEAAPSSTVDIDGTVPPNGRKPGISLVKQRLQAIETRSSAAADGLSQKVNNEAVAPKQSLVKLRLQAIEKRQSLSSSSEEPVAVVKPTSSLVASRRASFTKNASCPLPAPLTSQPNGDHSRTGIDNASSRSIDVCFSARAVNESDVAAAEIAASIPAHLDSPERMPLQVHRVLDVDEVIAAAIAEELYAASEAADKNIQNEIHVSVGQSKPPTSVVGERLRSIENHGSGRYINTSLADENDNQQRSIQLSPTRNFVSPKVQALERNITNSDVKTDVPSVAKPERSPMGAFILSRRGSFQRGESMKQEADTETSATSLEQAITEEVVQPTNPVSLSPRTSASRPKSMVGERLKKIERRISGRQSDGWFDDEESEDAELSTPADSKTISPAPVQLNPGRNLVSPRIQAIERTLSADTERNMLTPTAAIKVPQTGSLVAQRRSSFEPKSVPEATSASARAVAKEDKLSSASKGSESTANSSSESKNDNISGSVVQSRSRAIERRLSGKFEGLNDCLDQEQTEDSRVQLNPTRTLVSPKVQAIERTLSNDGNSRSRAFFGEETRPAIGTTLVSSRRASFERSNSDGGSVNVAFPADPQINVSGDELQPVVGSGLLSDRDTTTNKLSFETPVRVVQNGDSGSPRGSLVLERRKSFERKEAKSAAEAPVVGKTKESVTPMQEPSEKTPVSLVSERKRIIERRLSGKLDDDSVPLSIDSEPDRHIQLNPSRTLVSPKILALERKLSQNREAFEADALLARKNSFSRDRQDVSTSSEIVTVPASAETLHPAVAGQSDSEIETTHLSNSTDRAREEHREEILDANLSNQMTDETNEDRGQAVTQEDANTDFAADFLQEVRLQAQTGTDNTSLTSALQVDHIATASMVTATTQYPIQSAHLKLSGRSHSDSDIVEFCMNMPNLKRFLSPLANTHNDVDLNQQSSVDVSKGPAIPTTDAAAVDDDITVERFLGIIEIPDIDSDSSSSASYDNTIEVSDGGDEAAVLIGVIDRNHGNSGQETGSDWGVEAGFVDSLNDSVHTAAPTVSDITEATDVPPSTSMDGFKVAGSSTISVQEPVANSNSTENMQTTPKTKSKSSWGSFMSNSMKSFRRAKDDSSMVNQPDESREANVSLASAGAGVGSAQKSPRTPKAMVRSFSRRFGSKLNDNETTPMPAGADEEVLNPLQSPRAEGLNGGDSVKSAWTRAPVTSWVALPLNIEGWDDHSVGAETASQRTETESRVADDFGSKSIDNFSMVAEIEPTEIRVASDDASDCAPESLSVEQFGSQSNDDSSMVAEIGPNEEMYSAEEDVPPEAVQELLSVDQQDSSYDANSVAAEIEPSEAKYDEDEVLSDTAQESLLSSKSNDDCSMIAELEPNETKYEDDEVLSDTIQESLLGSKSNDDSSMVAELEPNEVRYEDDEVLSDTVQESLLGSKSIDDISTFAELESNEAKYDEDEVLSDAVQVSRLSSRSNDDSSMIAELEPNEAKYEDDEVLGDTVQELLEPSEVKYEGDEGLDDTVPESLLGSKSNDDNSMVAELDPNEVKYEGEEDVLRDTAQESLPGELLGSNEKNEGSMVAKIEPSEVITSSVEGFTSYAGQETRSNDDGRNMFAEAAQKEVIYDVEEVVRVVVVHDAVCTDEHAAQLDEPDAVEVKQILIETSSDIAHGGYVRAVEPGLLTAESAVQENHDGDAFILENALPIVSPEVAVDPVRTEMPLDGSKSATSEVTPQESPRGRKSIRGSFIADRMKLFERSSDGSDNAICTPSKSSESVEVPIRSAVPAEQVHAVNLYEPPMLVAAEAAKEPTEASDDAVKTPDVASKRRSGRTPTSLVSQRLQALERRVSGRQEEVEPAGNTGKLAGAASNLISPRGQAIERNSSVKTERIDVTAHQSALQTEFNDEAARTSVTQTDSAGPVDHQEEDRLLVGISSGSEISGAVTVANNDAKYLELSLPRVQQASARIITTAGTNDVIVQPPTPSVLDRMRAIERRLSGQCLVVPEENAVTDPTSSNQTKSAVTPIISTPADNNSAVRTPRSVKGSFIADRMRSFERSGTIPSEESVNMNIAGTPVTPKTVSAVVVEEVAPVVEEPTAQVPTMQDQERVALAEKQAPEHSKPASAKRKAGSGLVSERLRAIERRLSGKLGNDGSESVEAVSPQSREPRAETGVSLNDTTDTTDCKEEASQSDPAPSVQTPAISTVTGTAGISTVPDLVTVDSSESAHSDCPSPLSPRTNTRNATTNSQSGAAVCQSLSLLIDNMLVDDEAKPKDTYVFVGIEAMEDHRLIGGIGFEAVDPQVVDGDVHEEIVSTALRSLERRLSRKDSEEYRPSNDETEAQGTAAEDDGHEDVVSSALRSLERRLSRRASESMTVDETVSGGNEYQENDNFAEIGRELLPVNSDNVASVDEEAVDDDGHEVIVLAALRSLERRLSSKFMEPTEDPVVDTHAEDQPATIETQLSGADGDSNSFICGGDGTDYDDTHEVVVSTALRSLERRLSSRFSEAAVDADPDCSDGEDNTRSEEVEIPSSDQGNSNCNDSIFPARSYEVFVVDDDAHEVVVSTALRSLERRLSSKFIEPAEDLAAKNDDEDAVSTEADVSVDDTKVDESVNDDSDEVTISTALRSLERRLSTRGSQQLPEPECDAVALDVFPVATQAKNPLCVEYVDDIEHDVIISSALRSLERRLSKNNSEQNDVASYSEEGETDESGSSNANRNEELLNVTAPEEPARGPSTDINHVCGIEVDVSTDTKTDHSEFEHEDDGVVLLKPFSVSPALLSPVPTGSSSTIPLSPVSAPPAVISGEMPTDEVKLPLGEGNYEASNGSPKSRGSVLIHLFGSAGSETKESEPLVQKGKEDDLPGSKSLPTVDVPVATNTIPVPAATTFRCNLCRSDCAMAAKFCSECGARIDRSLPEYYYKSRSSMSKANKLTTDALHQLNHVNSLLVASTDSTADSGDSGSSPYTGTTININQGQAAYTNNIRQPISSTAARYRRNKQAITGTAAGLKVWTPDLKYICCCLTSEKKRKMPMDQVSTIAEVGNPKSEPIFAADAPGVVDYLHPSLQHSPLAGEILFE